jgi:hypothetical protein
MKTLTVRLPDSLAVQVETEARTRGLSKSAIIRERLSASFAARDKVPPSLQDIADLIGSVKGLPSDLSARKKYYLTPAYLRRR